MSDEQVARDAIRAILGDQPEWRDDEQWWHGVVLITNRLLKESAEKDAQLATKQEELAQANGRLSTLRNVVDQGLNSVVSMNRWKQMLRDEAQRRREAGVLNLDVLAKEAGISYSTLYRILNPRKRTEAKSDETPERDGGGVGEG